MRRHGVAGMRAGAVLGVAIAAMIAATAAMTAAAAAAAAAPGDARAQATAPVPTTTSATPSATPRAPWVAPLEAEFAAIDQAAEGGTRLGVFVRDLDSGDVAAYRAEQRWYWASMVKVPVAIAVLRAVERGEVTLDTPVTLRASDYVDGAGPTRHQPVGAHLTVRWLMEQMLVWSDNTATDVLIHLVDVAAVNAVLDEALAAWPAGSRGPVTTLGEVRRRIYGQLVPDADRLSGRDLMMLRDETGDAERLLALKRLLGPGVGKLRLPTLQAAYDAYYATGANSGRLDAYADLLAQLVGGRLLQSDSTRTLLDVMGRVQTGQDRIRAGLPPGTAWAHKTGTQRRRVCDAGLIRVPLKASGERRLVVVACTRDGRTLAAAENTLRRVGLAVCKAGALDAASAHAACPADDSPLAPPRATPVPRR